MVFGVTAGIPVAEERFAEKAVLEAIAPKSAVEYTPVGIVGLAVLNVLVETQIECPEAVEVPFIPFRVASVEVIAVAGFVITKALLVVAVVLALVTVIVYVLVVHASCAVTTERIVLPPTFSVIGVEAVLLTTGVPLTFIVAPT